MTVPVKPQAGEIMESVLIKGDLADLTPQQRSEYYMRVCQSIGLNPLTKPLEYIKLNGKLTLYAKRDCADQLRRINGISLQIVSQDQSDGLLSVHVRAKDRDGREDEDLGIVALPDTLKGEGRANAILKAVTKAKRRVTLSISGLGFLDETEIEDIPASAKRPPPPAANVMLPPHDEHGEIIENRGGSAAPSATGAGAVVAGKSDPVPAPPVDDLTATLMRHDKELEEAAKHGMAALQKAYNALPDEIEPHLRSACNRRHKVVAKAVDEGHGTQS